MNLETAIASLDRTKSLAPGPALSVFLAALGFGAMAEDAKTETDPARLYRYARIVFVNAPKNCTGRLQRIIRAAGLNVPAGYYSKGA